MAQEKNGEPANMNGNANGNDPRSDGEKQQAPLHRSAFRAMVQDFTPLWFTWCMNSGILGILYHECPYQFRGLQVISTVAYVIDLALFTIFSILFILRFVMFKSKAYQEITSSQADLMLVACWPIAFMTLTTLTALIPSNASWGGHAFTLVAYVMFWFVVGWNLVVLFFVFTTLISKHLAASARIPTMIIIPAVSVSTIALTGSIVATLSFDISPRLAVPVIIYSFMSVGMGILIGMILSTFLFHGLLTHGWPPPPQTASVFIFVGPMGQSAAALQQLGAGARSYHKFAGYNKGTFLTAEAALPLEVACVLIALLLYGLGVIWTILSVIVMVQRAIEKKLTWTPTWNAIIFPMGTLTAATSFLAIEMDSPAFRVIETGLIIILTIVYLINVVFTLRGIMRGQLLIVKEDPRVKKQIEEQQKEK